MGKKQPENWKNILKKINTNAPTVKGHDWIIVGGGGGTEARSWSPTFDRDEQARYIKYRCVKCGATAKKEVGGEFLLDKSEWQDLTCTECSIHDIIV